MRIVIANSSNDEALKKLAKQPTNHARDGEVLLTLIEDGKALTFQIGGGRVELCQPLPRGKHSGRNGARAGRNRTLHRQGGQQGKR